MHITLTSIFVDDQAKALDFYTNTLGFQLKHDIPLGEHRWLTVVAPDRADGPEIVLEPSSHPAVPPFKNALFEDGIPFNSFAVTDVHATHKTLLDKGVHFVQPPTDFGPVITAVFDDTCGNLLQIAQQK
jgi:catechol 2,3-dioxygenase-like lactoylglutathione lyase family enzyme